MQPASSPRAGHSLSFPRAGRARAGAATLLTLIAATIAGCGGESKSAPASSSATAPASTHKATGSTSATTGTSVRTASAPHLPGHVTSTSTSAAPPAPRSPAVASGRRYAGYGNRAIGTIALKSAVKLSWKTTQPKIQVFTSAGFVLVNSTKPSGSVQLSKGTYRGVRVASAGAWSLLVAPLH